MTSRVRSAQESAALILAAQRAAPLLWIRACRAKRDHRNVVLSVDEAMEIALQFGQVAEIAERADVLETGGGDA